MSHIAKPYSRPLVIRDAQGVAQADSQPGHSPKPEALVEQTKLPECVSNSAPWYVARHRPYEGHIASERAREAGFPAISPRQTIRRPGRDDVIVPVFPGYLFVQFPKPWGELLRPPIGMLAILCSASRDPLPLPRGFVSAFVARASADGIFPWWWPGEEPVNPASRMGRSFEVTEGPWKEFVGRCVASERNKVALLLGLFKGRPTPVELRTDQIREVHD